MRNNCGIISSNALDYQAFLEKHFVVFLTEQGASEKTRNNYRSDLRHFLAWITLTIASRRLPMPSSHQELLGSISPDLLQNYKFYLVKNNVSAATINRRLSTIRMFFRCCLSYGWTANNPTVTMSNIVNTIHPQNNPMNQILSHWKKDLEQEGASKSTIKNYVIDVRKFLEFVEKKS